MYFTHFFLTMWHFIDNLQKFCLGAVVQVKKKLHRLSPVRRYGEVCDAPLGMCLSQVLAHVDFIHVSIGCAATLMVSYYGVSYRYYRSHASEFSVLSVAIPSPVVSP